MQYISKYLCMYDGVIYYTVGGWVRDKYLKLPGKPDIDIALDTNRIRCQVLPTHQSTQHRKRNANL